MTNPPGTHPQTVSSLSLLDRAGQGETLPPPERMPQPELRLLLPMRDGVRLDTNVWLPAHAALPAPTILLRTPYKESTMGFKRLGVLRYVDAGYVVVIQQIRGVGASGGRFAFSAPHERSDGFDTIEWIAQQSWCTGAVGMDGSSYVAMTQLAAAAAHPPALRCIAPAVPCLDFFREVPYCGGIFSRQHTLNWMRLVQIDSLNELSSGFAGTLPILSRREHFDRMMARPLREAAEGMLDGDYRQHYLDALEHERFDDWWQARTVGARELAGIDIPVLVISGNFDLGFGAMTLWQGLHSAGRPTPHRLLVGPWDHGQCYAGGEASHGPYRMGEDSVLDLGALRLAFFDQHLRLHGNGLPWATKARVFVTGSNRWLEFDAFPASEIQVQDWYLDSGGRANSVRGDGRLVRAEPGAPVGDAGASSDCFIDDPGLPFIGGIAAAHEPDSYFDLRERERHHETLVYDSGPLAAPITLLGEGTVELYVCADTPDADVIVWLAEFRADRQTVRLAFGQLRLRYRHGFDAPRPLVPGEVVQVRIALNHVGHTLPAGSHLRLLVGGNNFPWADPNPHTGEAVAGATQCRVSLQSVFHDAGRPSRLQLPVLR